RYNQSGGSHTLQRTFGCDVFEDGAIRGFYQYGYDGGDYIAFDKDTMTFSAADDAAQITKRKWEEEGIKAQKLKQYLEHTCIEDLKRYMEYGKAVLE
ncbi:HA1F protein, partial [Penelope pileata]|nr:HA1F protein [Penelope pileata]